jgi:hypothetical protein
MKNQILTHIYQPRQLEKLYRSDKARFKRAFASIYDEIEDRKTAEIWHERLYFEPNEITWGAAGELTFVIIASIIAGVLAKLPELLGIESDYFYQRNWAFIVFPLLTGYFTWKQKPELKNSIIVLVLVLVSMVYINLLPVREKSDTILLACIHLPLFLWGALGFSFIGNNWRDYRVRLDFLRYNGDLVVMTTVILISGILLTVVTFGLFSIIEFGIEDFYVNYVVIWGLAASPIVATYLVNVNPQLVNKVAPIIARIFTPMVILTLVIYLIVILYSGKNPYNDRDFLLTFNVLLVVVMALIFFSVAESSKESGNLLWTKILLMLAAITIIINGIALSAILFRITEWGFTPNRLAVLGSNVLIMVNLILVTIGLFYGQKNDGKTEQVERLIASFLPVYGLWSAFMVFIFPLLYGFR